MASQLDNQGTGMDDIVQFVEAVTTAMGLNMKATVEETADGLRVDIEGQGGELLIRRRGEALNALQHLVGSVFRDAVQDGQRIAVDCQGFRRDKDAELKKMAVFLAEKAQSTNVPQEIGPLNPYERRIVHMAIAEVPNATSESIGDAFMKTVIISSR
jgi:spoIIIJ-associated protein